MIRRSLPASNERRICMESHPASSHPVHCAGNALSKRAPRLLIPGLPVAGAPLGAQTGHERTPNEYAKWECQLLFVYRLR